jgi:uncharacterized protein (DUF924 family)
MPIASPEDVLAFWFAPEQEKRWYAKDAQFDAEIQSRFLATYEAAVSGKLNAWRDAPRSTLALIVVLDQFPRNMFRGSPRTFAADAQAAGVCKEGIEKGFDRDIGNDELDFFHMPLMHSESPGDHDLFLRAHGDNEFAREHREIIARFGRYPHRNEILGRENTTEEDLYLRQSPPSF